MKTQWSRHPKRKHRLSRLTKSGNKTNNTLYAARSSKHESSLSWSHALFLGPVKLFTRGLQLLFDLRAQSEKNRYFSYFHVIWESHLGHSKKTVWRHGECWSCTQGFLGRLLRHSGTSYHTFDQNIGVANRFFFSENIQGESWQAEGGASESYQKRSRFRIDLG